MASITLLRRAAAALAVAATLLLPGCGGKDSGGDVSSAVEQTVALTVKVNYTRIPLLKDANGVPTGLETNAANFQVLPARGIRVRLWVSKDETNPDGTKTRVWFNSQTVTTDGTGSAAFSAAPKDTDAFVEVLSLAPYIGERNIRIVGDPAGINSGLSVGERLTYALRKGLDGSAPAGVPLPAGKVSAPATVTFDVGLGDKWWLTLLGYPQIKDATLEPTGTGSRILAILDSTSAYALAGIGTALPGESLDLHYRMGLSEPRGSFIEYDRARYPLSFDSSTQAYRYFGSIRGGGANDDAFDEGVLFPLFARNGLWALGFATPNITGKALPDILPDSALVEALPFVQAATALKSPYLADTTAASVLNTDIRALGSFASGPSSGPGLVALGWEITLKANSLPIPGVVADWEKINPLATARFFSISAPTDLSDRPNIFLQLGRLKEAQLTGEPVNLSAIFTDAALTTMTAPYNITWPRPTTGAGSTYIADWGKDPNSLAVPIPPVNLNMSKATAVDGVFPNTSSGEAAYSKFTLSKDTAFNLSVTTNPAVLPAGTMIEFRLFSQGLAYQFSGSGASPIRIVLKGNKDAALAYLARVALISPSNVAPDVAVTISLDSVN